MQAAEQHSRRPPLKKFVSKTVEAGARGKLDPETTWSAAIFRTDLDDDLQFISSKGVAVNASYFQNLGTTRRQGFEFGDSARLGGVSLALRCNFIDATFRTGFVENSPSNSTADANGAILVRRGDRIPIPRHSLKLRTEVNVTAPWSIAANVEDRQQGVRGAWRTRAYGSGVERSLASRGVPLAILMLQ